MKKFLLNYLKFFIFFLLISLILFFISNSILTTGSKYEWIFSKRNGKYDFVVLGSSRAENMISVKILNNELNSSGINIATAGSNFADNLIVLKKFLESNSTNNIILNIDQFSLNSYKSFSYPFHYYEFIKFFYQQDVREVIKDYIPFTKYGILTFFPFLNTLEFYNSYKLKTVERTDHLKKHDINFGTIYFKDSIKKEFKTSPQILSINELDKKYFEKIVDLCNKEKIKLILVTTPLLEDIYKFKENSLLSFEYIKNFSLQNNLEYINYSELGDFNDTTYFKDYTHTTEFGTNYYTKLLSKKIKFN